ncbi:hypothetical protein BDP27DRAFT_1331371 [Rhodocollybia butyracea]|uniref:F-box domain-containing protein n=1 Tax=Rhodocollybia butyracea TaxID=206335 RepID=A0A9P5U4S6_9AGAR|nr:hypothetical protein BDP27DRAFT_1331371 [Rhodocollybia butyracea]
MLNDDIIRGICAELDGFEAVLLSLGLASRIFLEPALDVLWKRMDSIELLLSVLPETTLVNGKKMFLKPIAPSSRDRLHFYTSRVREFYDWERDERFVHDSVYAYLGHERPIFPKLRTLHITHRLCSSNSFTFFLATSLMVVSWPWHSRRGAVSSPDLGPSLAFLVSKSPGLKSLTLEEHTYSGLSLSLRRLLVLESLSVRRLSYLGADFIQTIALLPRLTDLSLTIPAAVVLDYTGVKGGFPSLTKITLEGSTSDTRKFLAAARPQALQDLTINFNLDDQTPRPADIATITHSISSFPFLAI